MAVVFLIQISEALGGFALFPFVVFMLRDLGVSGGTGFGSLLGASFFIGQVFSSYHWGAWQTLRLPGMLVFGGLAASFSSAVLASCRT